MLNRSRLVYAAIISNYIVFILLVFQPFGINNYRHHFDIDLVFVLVLLLFDVAGFIILIILGISYKVIFRKHPLKLWAELAIDWLALSCMSFYIYNFLGDWHDYRFLSFVEFLYSCLVLLAPPYLILFIRERERKKQSGLIHLKNSTDKTDLIVSPSQIIFIKSEDNYVNVHYLKNGTVQKRLIRNTLSETRKILPKEFLQCHRSYIINPAQVESFLSEGRSKKLKMKNWQEEIPVSIAKDELASNFN